MNAVGDMCHHTKNAIIKHEIWKTDKLGFRNDAFIDSSDILFIGDSFIEGSALTQVDILSNQVRRIYREKIKVYNLAPSSFNEFDKLLKTGVIKKPKLIVFSIVERYLPEKFVPYVPVNEFMENALIDAFSFGNLNVYLDKALKLYSIHWIQARMNGHIGYGIQSPVNPKMFFLQGAQQTSNLQNVEIAKNTILSYKKYCDTLGVKFLFLPMPDKETVYYELVPFDKQPNYYLFTLDSVLNDSKVETINTLQLYNDYRKTSKGQLYHFDDTHWSKNAVELVAKAIVNKIGDF
jgi:hypothetical protein